MSKSFKVRSFTPEGFHNTSDSLIRREADTTTSTISIKRQKLLSEDRDLLITTSIVRKVPKLTSHDKKIEFGDKFVIELTNMKYPANLKLRTLVDYKFQDISKYQEFKSDLTDKKNVEKRNKSTGSDSGSSRFSTSPDE